MAEARYMLDASILLCLLRGTSSAARAKVESFEPGEVVTSAVAFAATMQNATGEDEKKREQLEELLTAITLLPFDAPAALAYTMVPFRRGRLDRLIAAHALALGLVVVTNNEGDYSDVHGLVIENWTAA